MAKVEGPPRLGVPQRCKPWLWRGDQISKSADTWYPSWAADGNLYTSFTDGCVIDDHTGNKTCSNSGGKGPNLASTTGKAVILGDSPFALNVTQVGLIEASTWPYQGRYPCGQLVYKGHWWYGTYFLANPNSTLGNTTSGPNPGPNCGNWCIQGPLVDFRLSKDAGATWEEPRPKAPPLPSDMHSVARIDEFDCLLMLCDAGRPKGCQITFSVRQPPTTTKSSSAPPTGSISGKSSSTAQTAMPT